MALKIFISSVSGEFEGERQALREEIDKLQDLFVGMELFGSDPAKPADYCINTVEESDLYVGLFGDRYGSIEEKTKKSFTELEYEAAINKSIPCLIYFKGVMPSHKEAKPAATVSQQHAFKTRLQKNHIGYAFKDPNDLKLQFLIDFIKLLRGTLFDKAGPVQQGTISLRALHPLTKGLLKEQIKAVGQDKYIPDIYVEREAEKELLNFADFEEVLILRTTEILYDLKDIAATFGMKDARLPLSNLKAALKSHREAGALRQIISDLKGAFFFNEVGQLIRKINEALVEPAPKQYDILLHNIVIDLQSRPFVSRKLLAQLPDELFEVRRRAGVARALDVDTDAYRDLLLIFPAQKKEKVTLANELIAEIDNLNELNSQRCAVLVDRAGTGKTNVACHLAETLIEDHPVILLSGQMELSNEFDIEYYVQRRLEFEFRGIFSDWMNRIGSDLQSSNKWLFIIIDGINENSNLPLFIKLLKNFLPRIETRRIKLILTCRDLFWDLFHPSLRQSLFKSSTVPLHGFSEREWHEAIAGYMDRFRVKCTFAKSAQVALRNPLLLRFFSEAHSGQELGKVSNLRLLSIFDLYIKRISQNISEQLGLLRPDAITSFLTGAARAMWEGKKATVSLESLGVTAQEASNAGSIYSLILSENIILEETTHTHSTKKSIRFLYDEFMEYMLARTWVEQLSQSKESESEIARLLKEVIDAIIILPATFGSILFLDQMMKSHGQLVTRFIKNVAPLGDTFLTSQQVPMIYAFENIDFSNVDDELITILEKFEKIARNEVKDRLGPVILKALRKRPDHPFTRTFASQILSAQSTTDPRQPAISNKMKKEMASWLQSENAQCFTPKSDSIQLLPPARYHYTEDTKLNAISVLVGFRSSKDYDLIDEGIRSLGRTDLHSALQALEYLDLAEDEFVYKTISDYLDVTQPEYRIYCAWLLRERYGRQPANFLLRLLMDRETRVHHYTFSLFDERLIEDELIEDLLSKLEKHKEMKSWHLMHLIKLLDRRSNFHPQAKVEQLGPRIISTCEKLLTVPQASLRLAVYRTMMRYPEFINGTELLGKMKRDQDPYIQSLSNKQTAL